MGIIHLFFVMRFYYLFSIDHFPQFVFSIEFLVAQPLLLIKLNEFRILSAHLSANLTHIESLLIDFVILGSGMLLRSRSPIIF